MEEIKTEIINQENHVFFTESEILSKMAKLSTDSIKRIGYMGFDGVYQLLNTPNGFDKFIEICDMYIDAYDKMKLAVSELICELTLEENEIDKIITIYEGMSQEKRLELINRLNSDDDSKESKSFGRKRKRFLKRFSKK